MYSSASQFFFVSTVLTWLVQNKISRKALWCSGPHSGGLHETSPVVLLTSVHPFTTFSCLWSPTPFSAAARQDTPHLITDRKQPCLWSNMQGLCPNRDLDLKQHTVKRQIIFRDTFSKTAQSPKKTNKHTKKVSVWDLLQISKDLNSCHQFSWTSCKWYSEDGPDDHLLQGSSRSSCRNITHQI